MSERLFAQLWIESSTTSSLLSITLDHTHHVQNLGGVSEGTCCIGYREERCRLASRTGEAHNLNQIGSPQS